MKSYVSVLAKSRRKYHTAYLAGFLFLLIVTISGQKACAAVTEGKPGETYSGEYAVIVNAGEDGKESTGTLTFTEGTDTQSLSTGKSAGQSDETEVSLPYKVAELSEGVAKSSTGKSTGLATYGMTVYETGSQKIFYTYSGPQTFICIGSSEHCYIWMENSLKDSYDTAGKTSQIAADMAQTYEQGAYGTLYELSGGNIPCRDGSGKLSIALEQISGASGVYMGKGYEPDITAIHINTKAPDQYTYGSMRASNALLVHEGQHALFEQFTSYDYTQKYMGITEGLSVAAMEYAWGNSDYSDWLNMISGNNKIRNGSSILYRYYRDQSGQDYGMSYLFIRYLINRKYGDYNPASFFQAAYKVNASQSSAGTYLKTVMGGSDSFSDLLTDFYTAIAANEASGKYGFEGDAVVQSTLNSYPYYVGGSGSEVSLEPTAGIILHLGKGGTFTVPSNGGSHLRYRIIGEKNSTLNPAAGNGTTENPYEITSVKDWNKIANRPGASYKLMNDLTFTGSAVTMPGTFSGILDGGGHTIKGVTHPICSVNTGKIQNLNVEANVNGVASNMYGIITQINQGLIDHCVVTGNIKAILYGQYANVGTHTGVIAGENQEAGTIQYCIVTAMTELTACASSSKNGGIAGSNRGIIANCYFKGILKVNQTDPEATVYTGGIAGETGVEGGIGGSIKQCLNGGEILVNGGTAQTGQICGSKKNAYLANCYGKSNEMPLFGSEEEDTQQTTSKKLTEDEWKKSDAFTGLDFNTGWKMGTDGPEMIGSEDITSLELTGEPSYCYVGEELYWWGRLKVNDSYYITITSDMIERFDSSKQGYSRVLVKYMGKMIAYSIQVREPVTVTSLRISGPPKKTNYVEGQHFDPTGILLLAKIDGETQERYISSGFQFKSETLNTLDTSVTLGYYGKTISIPVTVSAKIPQELEIYEEQNRSYTVGALLDLSGVKVRITYSNGDKSAWITENEFDRYQIHLARKTTDSQSFAAVEKTQALRVTDNGCVYYLYVGNALPGSYDAVSCRLGTVTIHAPLQIDGHNLYFTVGKDCYGYLNLTGGSGSYQTVVKSENLPKGISRIWIPNETSGTFGYEGIAEQQGNYTSVYQVTDTVQKIQLSVQVTIHVQASNVVQMISFDLKMDQNSGLKKDVTGKITETQVILEVPEETDITNLMPNIDYGAGAGADCNYWNGSRLDFTNPVVYILTAPDGVTKRSYEVIVKKVKFSDEDQGSSGSNSNDNTNDNVGGNSSGDGQGNDSKADNTPGNTGAGNNGPGKPGVNNTTSSQSSVKKPGTSKPGAVTVKLNAISLPLQVKKSTTVLKVKEKSVGDYVAYWSSSNKKIVTVNSRTGKITAKKTGNAVITVKMKSGATAKCQIKVQKGKVKTRKIQTGKTAVTLKKGDTYRITWERQPLTSMEKVTFKSSGKKTASVSKKGVITAKKKGTAYITVKSGKKKCRIKVSVR